MPFVTLNTTTVRVQSNGMGQKYNEHGVDRFRTFDGAMRVTRRGIYREWNGNTAILSYADAATLVALLTTEPQPLALTGDLVGEETVAVMPILISNDPIHTAQGPLRRVVFTLHETPAALPPDTTAPIYRFYRRNTGLWQDWERTTPATIGDPVGAWDDQMNAEFFMAGGVNSNFPPPANPIDTGECPIRESHGIAFGDQGVMQFGEDGFLTNNGTINALEGTGCEIMIGVRLAVQPTTVAGLAGLWHTRWGGAVSGNSPDASTSVFFPHPNGNIYEHFGLENTRNVGVAPDGLTSLTCYNIVAFDDGASTPEWTARINETVLETTASEAVHLNSSHFWTFGRGEGGTPILNGWITDIVINAGRFTTDEPPLPE